MLAAIGEEVTTTASDRSDRVLLGSDLKVVGIERKSITQQHFKPFESCPDLDLDQDHLLLQHGRQGLQLIKIRLESQRGVKLTIPYFQITKYFHSVQGALMHCLRCHDLTTPKQDSDFFYDRSTSQ